MFAGVAVGYLFKRHKAAWVQKTITCLIWILLFMLGLGIGTDDSLFRSLPSIGGQAMVIGTATAIGSAAASWLLWRYIRKDNQ